MTDLFSHLENHAIPFLNQQVVPLRLDDGRPLAHTKPSKRRHILRKDLEDYLLRSCRLDSAPATM